MQNSTSQSTDSNCEDLFLPDFCSIRMVLAVVIVAELLAFVLILGNTAGRPWAWGDLGLVSLFVQWVALTSAALLCVVRRGLCRYSNTTAGLLSYGLVLLVTVVVSELAFRVTEYVGVYLPPGWHLDFLWRNLAIGAIFAAVVLRFFYLQHQQRVNLQAQSQARIEALQARIRPHFLFNSMNTIAALIRSQPERAEEAVEDLADLFRTSLADGGRMVPLGQELEAARRYLHIEKLRLGERLNVEWDVDGVPLHALLPPLTLQPLLENAIYHGIEKLPAGGTVAIRGQEVGGQVTLVLANPLTDDSDQRVRQGNRMAMENIRERLQFAFGRQGRLDLVKETARCRVELSFPVREAEQT